MCLQTQLALFLSAGAVCTDLFTEKVPNEWIWLGLGIGAGYQLHARGLDGLPLFLKGMLLPLLLLFPLFLFRMMGAGDIKLLSVLGGLLGTGTILRSMICSCLLGALLSFAFLMACGNLSERLSYFLRYIRACSRNRRFIPYMKPGSRAEHFHFTVPVFLGIMLYAGGFY